jgi:nickel-dependent lactate racemase
MKIDVPYGKEKLILDIPEENIQDIIHGKEAASHRREEDIIEEALLNPIHSLPLKEMAKGKTSACVLASDITRPSPSYKFLPYIIDELLSGGIEISNIKVILGLGIHRGHTEQEKRKLVGDQIFEKVKVLDSDPQKVKFLGYTDAGTPVEVFEEALGNDLLIATGNIEYHYFAGYSGGAKAVMPGVCNRRSIQANHSMMLDERAVAGKAFDNPVRKDIEEAGRITGVDFVFNVILDDNKRIIDAVAGKNNEAWLDGIKRYDDIYMIEVDRPADIVVSSAGGYPKDINLYQSQKALENIKDAARPGGTIILAASCCEGFGEDVFEEWMMEARDYDSISTRLKNDFVLGGHKAVAVSRVISNKEVFLFSEFDSVSTENMGFKKLEDIQAYLDKRIDEDDGIKITVLPHGRFVRIRR